MNELWQRYGSGPMTLLLGILTLAAVIGGCGKTDEIVEERLRPVRTVVAETSSGARAYTFSGTSRSSQESRLSFKVSGTLDSLAINVGDALRRGQAIARIDPSLYELEAQQAEANLLQAQAAERSAAANYQRIKGLYANNNASRNDLDTARANAESAEAQQRAAEKQLELARLSVSYTTLAVTTDCSVAAVEVEVNEFVAAGNTVAIVNCGRGLEVDLAIPESLIGGLHEGMAAVVHFDSLPDEAFSGTLTEVGVAALGGATFPATVAITGDHSQLRSGLAAEATFEIDAGGARDAMIVPLTAVIEDSDGRFVYLAEPEGSGEAVVTRRDVEVGELTEAGIEIVAGLAAGDQVVTAGTSILRAGQRVLLPVTTVDSDAGGSGDDGQD